MAKEVWGDFAEWGDMKPAKKSSTVKENFDDWGDWGDKQAPSKPAASSQNQSYQSNNSRYDQNESRYDQNESRYDRNESRSDRNESRYDRNESRSDRNFTRNNDDRDSRYNQNSRSDDRRNVDQHQQNSFQGPSASNTLTIRVASKEVGRVIGKGGSKIKELQEQSGARIKVLRDDDNGFDTGVQIIGDDLQRKAAENLIKEMTEGNAYPYSNSSSKSSVPNPVEEDMSQIDWGAVIAESIEATKLRWKSAPKIEKNFYIENSETAAMHPDDVKQYRISHNNIMATHFKEDDKRPIPNPTVSFRQAFEQYPALLAAVENQSFTEPSPVQAQAWPILLKGHDLIGIAQTGSGKTLAFLLPALVHIEGQPIARKDRNGPTVLIMAPTRELAQQIVREVTKFPYKDIKCVCVYGGGDRRQQMNAVAKGVEIVVATPGRLYDLMQNGVLKTSSVSYVVLDEADRMLDLGFEPQIKKILIDIRPDKQIIMTSATWPEGIRRIANDYMDNPLQVCVGTLDLAACHSVTQHIEIIAEEEKRQGLLDFIHSLGTEDKAIVFVGRKITADQISSDLCLNGIVCQSIHGDRDQIDREQALADLRSGEVRILVATDVASRGIDIKDITHILNYDFPRHAEEYVHRVGRTGRAGRTGIAISFFTREDWSKAADLTKILEEASQEVPEELYKMSERFSAWKERKDNERNRNVMDAGGFRGGREGGHGGGFGGGFGGGRGGGGNRRGGGFSHDFF